MYSKKMETTKIVMILMTTVLTSLTIIFSIVSVYMALKYQDISLMQILIPCVFTELASYTGWYCWKSKSENKFKIILSFIKDLDAQDVQEKGEIINNLVSNL